MLGFLFICILCLFLIGAPIFVALGMGTTLSIMLEGNFPLVLVPQRMFAGLDSWPIMAIPMFMLAGNLMDQGGMSKRIVDFASASIGFVKGSLAMVAVLASMIFAAISGSATAGTAAIGSIMTDYSAKYLNGSDWIFHRCICWSVIPRRRYSWSYDWCGTDGLLLYSRFQGRRCIYPDN